MDGSILASGGSMDLALTLLAAVVSLPLAVAFGPAGWAVLAVLARVTGVL